MFMHFLSAFMHKQKGELYILAAKYAINLLFDAFLQDHQKGKSYK